MAGILYSLLSAIFRIVPLKIFPERVLGSRFTIAAVLKEVIGPILSRTICEFGVMNLIWGHPFLMTPFLIIKHPAVLFL